MKLTFSKIGIDKYNAKTEKIVAAALYFKQLLKKPRSIYYSVYVQLRHKDAAIEQSHILQKCTANPTSPSILCDALDRLSGYRLF